MFYIAGGRFPLLERGADQSTTVVAALIGPSRIPLWSNIPDLCDQSTAVVEHPWLISLSLESEGQNFAFIMADGHFICSCMDMDKFNMT